VPRRRFSFSSELTYIILLILRHSLVPTRYISFLTGEPSKKISTYLSILKRKGLVRYENGFWTLTPQGERIADKLDSIFKLYSNIFYRANLNNYLKNNMNEDKKTKFIENNLNYSKKFLRNLNLSKEIMINELKNQLETTKTLDQVLSKAKEFLGRELSDIERAIVEFLFSFSSSRGRKYWWPEDSLGLAESLASKLSQTLGISISSIDVSYALKELEAAGVVFITYDKRRRVPKVRISRALLS